jgi:hypothetical protein
LGAAREARLPPAYANMENVMAVTLNKWSFDYARKLIQNRRCVLDEREDWTDHEPPRTAENRLTEEHGLGEFSRWHLGEDDELPESNKRRYKFPIGDFNRLHRCAVLAAETRAGQHSYSDIEAAAAHLHGMLDELMARRATEVRRIRHASTP